ncbi:lytic transglycosylase domain-containing protein [Roseovarius ramblicola]|uniref:Lytic transglycosylase domain-containing protein n=1 Tax=Roseovarius ramblicola TaxID=2022336 RepID=A0ABV5HVZ6_9RHOB
MLRVLAVVLICAIPASAVQATDPARIAPRPLASALHAMQADRWEVAARLAARDGPTAADLIEWYRLRAGRGTPDEVLGFLERNGHWPGLDRLRRASEAAIAGADFDTALAFYEGYVPRTGTGALNAARARLARGRRGEAEAGIVMAWRTLSLSTAEHADFLREFGAVLAPHHDARLDMALWRGLDADAALMLPLVSDAARARARIRARVAGGDTDGLSEAQTRDPGIAFALFNHHLDRSAGDAVAVLLRQSRIKGGLGEAERWAGWRRALARQAMRDGEATLAYEIAALHQLSEGANYADLEWLAGYIALVHLDEPALSRDHFQRFRTAVGTPISLGRAGYWLGRALDAAGDAETASDAYAGGADHPTSFYGLLAAEKLGRDVAGALAGTATAPPWRQAAFAGTDLHQIVTLALDMGETGLARRFLLHLSETQDRQGLAQMGAMLEEIGTPYLEVMLGKAAAERGIVLPATYYPLHPVTGMDLPVPMEWALAIARRESEFNPVVMSGAGARGLMQLMPATAREMARDTGLDTDARRLVTDWQHNARLGAAYLAELRGRYEGNPLLMAAAYNAGPGRVSEWVETYGDPRGMSPERVIDWIEHLPFRETRNYAMRVAESLPVYRARLGRPALPRPFSQEIGGRDSARTSD